MKVAVGRCPAGGAALASQRRSAVWRNGEQDGGGAAHRSSRRSGRHDREALQAGDPRHRRYVLRGTWWKCYSPGPPSRAFVAARLATEWVQTLRSRPVRCCFKFLAFPPNKVPEGIAHQPLQAYSLRFVVAEACAGSIRKPLNRATSGTSPLLAKKSGLVSTITARTSQQWQNSESASGSVH
jgi:hypothetical protein